MKVPLFVSYVAGKKGSLLEELLLHQRPEKLPNRNINAKRRRLHDSGIR